MNPDKLTKAKIQLYLNYPFFATLILKMKFIEDKSVPTARTDGKHVRYNPEYIEKIPIDKLVGLLASVAMKPALLHHTRRQNRDIDKWNVSSELVVNPLLLQSNIRLPDGFLDHKQFHDKTIDDVYLLLPPGPMGQAGQGSGAATGSGKDGEPSNACGEVEDAKAQTQSELDQAEAEMKQNLAEAATVAKQQGKMPANLQQFVDEILTPKISWKDVLNVFMTQSAQNDYTWSKPSHRYLHAGLYLPSIDSRQIGCVIFIGDSSGSVWDDKVFMGQFAAEAQDVINTFHIPIKVIWVDTQVAAVEDIEADEVLQLNPKGGGGTSFVPGFEHIEEEGLDPCAVIYITDGYCDDFPKEPSYPVLWVVFNNKSFVAPFGEVLHI